MCVALAWERRSWQHFQFSVRPPSLSYAALLWAESSTDIQAKIRKYLARRMLTMPRLKDSSGCTCQETKVYCTFPNIMSLACCMLVPLLELSLFPMFEIFFLELFVFFLSWCFVFFWQRLAFTRALALHFRSVCVLYILYCILLSTRSCCFLDFFGQLSKSSNPSVATNYGYSKLVHLW